MPVERTISTKLLRKGKNFSFKTDRVLLSNGNETVRDIVVHPGAVAILPVIDDGLILVRQYRYATGVELLELPAGTLEEGESPQVCAARELTEETGYAASSWRKLLSCYMAPGYSSEKIHFYVAEGLTRVGADPEEDEILDVERYSFNEVIGMIEGNVLEDSKTITGILAYLTRT